MWLVRGAGDPLSVGERIAFYRRRRGLTQARRLDVLTEVARALRVSLPDLLGQPVLMEDEERQDDIPAVRDALMAPRRLPRLLYRPTEAVKVMHRRAPVTSRSRNSPLAGLAERCRAVA